MELDIGRSSRRRTDLKAGDGNYTSVIKIDVQVREPCDFTEPVFILTRFNNYESCNYVYVAHWSRYYFINEITVNGNLIELHCVEDYLASWYSQITSQTLFCTRSASDPNTNLADNTFPRESQTKRVIYTFNSPYTGHIFQNTGFFVLAVNGSKPIINGGIEVDAYIGTTNYYLFPPESMQALCEKLYETDVWSLAQRTINDPMEFFVRCYYMPFDIDDVSAYIQKTSSHFSLSLGSMALEIDADVYIWKSEWFDERIPSFGKSTEIYPTSNFFDNYNFLNHAPYSHLYMYTRPDGLIELGDNVISAFYESTQSDPLIINYAIDITSGTLLMRLSKDDHSIFYKEMKCCVDIQLSEMIYNIGDVVNGLTTTAMGAFLMTTGAGAAASVAGAGTLLNGVTNGFMAALSPDIENKGSSVGTFNTISSGDWFLMRTYNPVNLYPAAYGLPCCKTETLGNLTGFAQFEPVNIKTANGMLAKEQAEIEALLRRGVFINE